MNAALRNAWDASALQRTSLPTLAIKHSSHLGILAAGRRIEKQACRKSAPWARTLPAPQRAHSTRSGFGIALDAENARHLVFRLLATRMGICPQSINARRALLCTELIGREGAG